MYSMNYIDAARVNAQVSILNSLSIRLCMLWWPSTCIRMSWCVFQCNTSNIVEFHYSSCEHIFLPSFQLLDEIGVFIKDIKFSLDPTIMSFDMLQSLLAKAFEVRRWWLFSIYAPLMFLALSMLSYCWCCCRDFSISYVATDHLGSSINLALLNDWDLDAAILSSSDPSLVLTVQLKPIDLCK